MVRAPCCEKMGLKKGPWTYDEDQTLVSYIQRHGHGNWRALPKLAGLLRCGKSCRLRWTNYLRPDIKRGNFSREEEDMIINLHEMLGNRWSAIAARLPGRTDNEIKNVWHTHLKKRLTNQNHSDGELPKRKAQSPQPKAAADQTEPKPVRLQQNSVEYASNPTMVMQTSSIQSSFDNSISDISSSSTSSSIAMETYEKGHVTNESAGLLWEELVELDQSFWNEVLLMDNCAAAAAAAAVPMDATAVQGNNNTFSRIDEQLNSDNDEDTNFWLRIFMEAGELTDLPEL